MLLWSLSWSGGVRFSARWDVPSQRFHRIVKLGMGQRVGEVGDELGGKPCKHFERLTLDVAGIDECL